METNFKINAIVEVSTSTDDDELNEFLEEHGNIVIIEQIEDDYFWGKTQNDVKVPYHLEARDITNFLDYNN